jgi:RNA polymerase sigma-70 factor (ECF subfamily)
MALIYQLKPSDRQLMLLYLDDLDAASIGEVTGVQPSSRPRQFCPERAARANA